MPISPEALSNVVSMAMLEADLSIDVDSIVAGAKKEAGVEANTAALIKVWSEDFRERVAALDPGARGAVLARLRLALKPNLDVVQYKKALNSSAESPNGPPRSIGSNLPVIQINSRPMREVVAESIQAIQRANDPPKLFTRASKMVYIGEDNDRPAIVLVSPDYFRSRLEESANWVHSSNTNTRPVQSPLDVTRHILAQPASTWGMPGLEGLVETPTLRRDGSVLDTEGYDEVSGLYYLPAQGLTMPHIPDRPTSDEVAAAVKLIDYMITDFPFDSDASHANYFALLLTPVLRQAIDGLTPLALIDAPACAAGKTLLTDVFANISTGRDAAKMELPDDNAELNKTIGSCLMAGDTLLVFDNVDKEFAHPGLALALTSREFKTRILGVSKTMEVPNNATWVANGNQMRPGGDIIRRCYWVRIKAKVTGRSKFEIPQLKFWTKQHRGKLLAALLTMARAWFAAGRPEPKSSPMDTFEEWSSTVGGILEHAGVNGFRENTPTMHRQSDVESAQWEAFLVALHEVFADAAFTTADLAAILHETESDEPTVRASALADRLPETFPKGNNEEFNLLAGKRFAKQADKPFGVSQIQIARGPMRHGSQQWKVLLGEESTQI
jgi:hypothetical protein